MVIFSLFNIYIDEYENLVEYQQHLINTWVKHSESPVIFNLAMKRNAFKTKKTIGNESLSNIHDYRIHDLEEMPSGKRGFMVFSGEILLNRLQNDVNFRGFSFKPQLLKNLKGFEERRNSNYQKNILSIVDQIFPSISKKELANSVNDDQFLRKRFHQKLQTALIQRNSNIPVGDFLVYDDMRISFVSVILLNRENIKPQKILSEIQKFRDGKQNNFFNSTDWVQNNFVGSYLYFFSSLNRVCPLFTGFRTFCEMSNGNIRHLTELCYKTFLRASDDKSSSGFVELWQISLQDQAQAAEQASTNFLNEIKTFGRYGNQLHTFTHRIGALFALAQKVPKQSEPEQNHFSIVQGKENNEEISLLLNEAVKWSVLFEEKSTKKKSSSDPDLIEYVLNPIYSPYFRISYRKKRKLEINYETLEALSIGSLDKFESILKFYRTKWNLDETIKEHNLFTDLDI